MYRFHFSSYSKNSTFLPVVEFFQIFPNKFFYSYHQKVYPEFIKEFSTETIPRCFPWFLQNRFMDCFMELVWKVFINCLGLFYSNRRMKTFFGNFSYIVCIFLRKYSSGKIKIITLIIVRMFFKQQLWMCKLWNNWCSMLLAWMANTFHRSTVKWW